MSKYVYEGDYSGDMLRWIDKIAEIKRPLNDHKALEKIQDEIILANDAAMAYFFASEFSYKPHRMQKVILDKGDAKYAFIFAQNIKNADIKALQNIVIDSKKIKYITKFACFVKQADRKSLETLIVKSKKSKYAHMYMKHIKNVNIKKFKDIIIESAKPRYLFELAKHSTCQEDINQIQDLIIQSNSFTYMRLFAEKIDKADVAKIEQVVLASDNAAEIKKFAKYVKKSKMRNFLLMV